MKKIFICLFMLLMFSFSITAQALYFDIGIGFGFANTKIDDVDVSSYFGPSVSDIGAELGLKLGYGPVLKVPLYFVAEFGGIGHRFSEASDYIQFNSYIIGPGVIFYPIPLIQLGASVGFSFVANQSNLVSDFYRSQSGYAWDLSAAIDLGKKNSGCLLGMKYTATNNTLEISNSVQQSSMFSFFVRYAYRHKNIN